MKLGKGIAASRASVAPPPSPGLPITPADRKAIDRLLLAIIAEMVLAAVSWSLHLSRGALHYWPAMLGVFLLYQLPYAFLVWRLKKPNRLSIAFALVIPLASLVSSVVNLGTILRFATDLPRSIATTVIFSALDIVIFVLALRVKRLRHPESLQDSLFAAGAVTLVYFVSVHFLSPLLYRLF